MAGNSSGFSTKDISESLLAQLKKDTSVESGKLQYSFILYQQKRELIETIRAQKKQKEELESTLAALKAPKDELKEEGTRMAYLRADLKEREMRLCVAKKKLEQQKKLNEELDERICALREELQAEQERGEHLRKQIKKLEPHCVFLEKVVQKSGQFRDVDELMSHYYTLKSISETLALASRRTKEKLANSKAELAQYTQQCNETLLQHSTALAQEQRALEAARAQRKQLESKWAQIQSTTSEKVLELVTLKTGILNLYRILYEKIGADFDDDPVDPEDTFAQLKKIPEYLDILTSIDEELNK